VLYVVEVRVAPNLANIEEKEIVFQEGAHPRDYYYSPILAYLFVN
jgi:hypothetical protein